MFQRAGLIGVLLLGGCDLIDQGRDLIGDLTNPLVTQALVLGVAPPDEASDIDLPSEYAEGAGATVFLADAADVADLENAPISGATVTLHGQAVGELAPGSYALEPGAISYESGGTWQLAVTLSGDTATAAVDLPPAASFTVPSGDGASRCRVVVAWSAAAWREVAWGDGEPEVARLFTLLTHVFPFASGRVLIS